MSQMLVVVAFKRMHDMDILYIRSHFYLLHAFRKTMRVLYSTKYEIPEIETKHEN